MKVINKILSFLSLFVLCVPLLCFNVSADCILDDYLNLDVPYYGLDFFQSDSDGGGSFIPSDNINSDGTLNFFSNNSSGSSSSAIILDNGNNYNKFPFYVIGSYSYNFLNPYVRFCHSLATSSNFTFNSTNKFYYFSYSISFTYSDGSEPIVRSYRGYDYTTEYLYDITVASFSPFYFEETSDGFIDIQSNNNSLYFYVHRSDIYHFTGSAPVSSMFSYSSVNVYSYSTSHPLYFVDYDLSKYCYEKTNPFYTHLDYEFTGAYCNFDINSDIFTSNSDKINKGFSSLQPKTLANQIDVKLTPEFTIGMDRSIPDSTFGISEDYWSLEVTNNNDFNIQFKCYVIPATGAVNYVSEWSHDDSLKSYSSGIPVLVNTDDFIPVVPDETVWMLEKDQWIYSKETENQEDYFKDTPYLVNKPTSNFFVQSGGTFKQVIKWNQLNLNKNQPYQILVTACECPYDRASDIHISLASDDYSQSFKHIIEESYFIIYDDKFSVTNPLYYDSSDTFGGVIANTGRTQVDTDYWKLNAIEKDGEIEIRNADYSNGWRLNPDGGADSGTLKEGLFNNLDDISLSDVTKLVQDTGSYLTLVATVFKFFPSWIWILLFAGISGLLVIGVFKMLH